MAPWWKLSSLDYYFEKVGMTSDPRTQHLLWTNVSPIFVLWKVFNFVMFSRILGPKIMKDVPAFDIRWLMFIYNCLMSLCNIYAVVHVISVSNYFRILLDFNYVDRNDMSSKSLYLIHLGYLYWLSKILDCWDTCFFVVRKKFEHITLLHVYHHTIVPVFGYILLKVNPLLPCVFLFSFVNSTIHVIMYSYYALAALGPWIQPYLWWKKYITLMQLWQFVLYGIYGAAILIFGNGYPPFWLYIGLTQPPFFFYLFLDFYMKAYDTNYKNLFHSAKKWFKWLWFNLFMKKTNRIKLTKSIENINQKMIQDDTINHHHHNNNQNNSNHHNNNSDHFNNNENLMIMKSGKNHHHQKNHQNNHHHHGNNNNNHNNNNHHHQYSTNHNNANLNHNHNHNSPPSHHHHLILNNGNRFRHITTNTNNNKK